MKKITNVFLLVLSLTTLVSCKKEIKNTDISSSIENSTNKLTTTSSTSTIISAETGNNTEKKEEIKNIETVEQALLTIEDKKKIDLAIINHHAFQNQDGSFTVLIGENNSIITAYRVDANADVTLISNFTKEDALNQLKNQLIEQ